MMLKLWGPLFSGRFDKNDRSKIRSLIGEANDIRSRSDLNGTSVMVRNSTSTASFPDGPANLHPANSTSQCT